MNYIPNVNYKTDSILYKGVKISCFNKAGYRGEVLPIKRTEKVRILFLGGSTTFQEGGSTLESTYPELTKKWLIENKYLDESIEIINAGIDGATSFDLLNNYLYKYKYYQPDVLVIHSGFNDCAWYIDSLYSPDYSHLNINLTIENLTTIQKKALVFLLKFKCTSWIVYKYINMNKKNIVKKINNYKVHREDYPQWLFVHTDSALSDKKINAFYNNIKSLVQIAKNDSAHVILMQMPYLSSHKYYEGIFGKAIQFHNQLTEEISKELDVPIVRLNDIEILDKEFTDIIHLDSIGNSKKGSAVGKVIAENIFIK